MMPQTVSPVLIRAVGGEMHAGQELTGTVEASGEEYLGAVTVRVSFDPNVVAVVACRRNSAFDVGLCNTDYDGDSDGLADAVVFNLVSLNGVSAGSGGGLVLAEITWKGLDVVTDTVTSLSVEVLTLTDENAIPLDYTVEGGQIAVLAPVKPTPTPTPTFTPTPSPTPIPTHTATPTSTPKAWSRTALHLPVVIRGKGTRPPPTALPEFQCSDWCTPGSRPGYWVQFISASKPVADWRAFDGSTYIDDLYKETATSAAVEAMLGQSLRVEALYGGAWLPACKSVVKCSAQGSEVQPGETDRGENLSIENAPSLEAGPALSPGQGESVHE
ncbi:MAG: hypothetical protein D6791_17750 [Chloroflexi bacterium]|nr:MAG: hypothetical protein D6791_17750 [Chloroflexota bacterium]